MTSAFPSFSVTFASSPSLCPSQPPSQPTTFKPHTSSPVSRPKLSKHTVGEGFHVPEYITLEDYLAMRGHGPVSSPYSRASTLKTLAIVGVLVVAFIILRFSWKRKHAQTRSVSPPNYSSNIADVLDEYPFAVSPGLDYLASSESFIDISWLTNFASTGNMNGDVLFARPGSSRSGQVVSASSDVLPTLMLEDPDPPDYTSSLLPLNGIGVLLDEEPQSESLASTSSFAPLLVNGANAGALPPRISRTTMGSNQPEGAVATSNNTANGRRPPEATVSTTISDVLNPSLDLGSNVNPFRTDDRSSTESKPTIVSMASTSNESDSSPSASAPTAVATPTTGKDLSGTTLGRRSEPPEDSNESKKITATTLPLNTTHALSDPIHKRSFSTSEVLLSSYARPAPWSRIAYSSKRRVSFSAIRKDTNLVVDTSLNFSLIAIPSGSVASDASALDKTGQDQSEAQVLPLSPVAISAASSSFLQLPSPLSSKSASLDASSDASSIRSSSSSSSYDYSHTYSARSVLASVPDEEDLLSDEFLAGIDRKLSFSDDEDVLSSPQPGLTGSTKKKPMADGKTKAKSVHRTMMKAKKTKQEDASARKTFTSCMHDSYVKKFSPPASHISHVPRRVPPLLASASLEAEQNAKSKITRVRRVLPPPITASLEVEEKADNAKRIDPTGANPFVSLPAPLSFISSTKPSGPDPLQMSPIELLPSTPLTPSMCLSPTSPPDRFASFAVLDGIDDVSAFFGIDTPLPTLPSTLSNSGVSGSKAEASSNFLGPTLLWPIVSRESNDFEGTHPRAPPVDFHVPLTPFSFSPMSSSNHLASFAILNGDKDDSEFFGIHSPAPAALCASMTISTSESSGSEAPSTPSPASRIRPGLYIDTGQLLAVKSIGAERSQSSSSSFPSDVDNLFEMVSPLVAVTTLHGSVASSPYNALASGSNTGPLQHASSPLTGIRAGDQASDDPPRAQSPSLSVDDAFGSISKDVLLTDIPPSDWFDDVVWDESSKGQGFASAVSRGLVPSLMTAVSFRDRDRTWARWAQGVVKTKIETDSEMSMTSAESFKSTWPTEWLYDDLSDVPCDPWQWELFVSNSEASPSKRAGPSRPQSYKERPDQRSTSPLLPLPLPPEQYENLTVVVRLPASVMRKGKYVEQPGSIYLSEETSPRTRSRSGSNSNITSPSED